MDFLSRYLTQIRAQLASLTISQRLTIGLLFVVIIGTIYMVVLNSAKPELVELLPGMHAQPQDISQMGAYLKGKYHYEVKGDSILVPVEQAYQIRGELASAQMLPKDTTGAFAELAKANDMFLPETSIERRWNYARQEVLAKVLRNFSYITDATVLISKGEQARLGRDAVPSSATVSLRLKNTETLSSNQVMAIVETVRGAIAGMRRDQVHVTDGNRSYTLPDESTPMAVGLLEFKSSSEKLLTDKLLQQLDLIPNVKVAVNVVPDWSYSTTQDRKIDKPVRAPSEETSKDSSSTESTAGGTPGVGANTNAIAAGTGARNGTTMSESTAKYHNEFPETVRKTELTPGAEVKKLTASISVPRSYFVALYRRTVRDPKAEPDDADARFASLITDNLGKIQKQAINAIGADSDKQVQVDWFDDIMAPPLAVAGGPGTLLAGGSLGGTSYGAMLGQYGKQAVLAAIALGALMMMLMMVRRAAPAAAGADADASLFAGLGGKPRRKDPAALDIGDDVIGEAGSGEAVLTGIELDDETLQSRKMVDEVSTMIKENPENAASLVKRWMTKSK